MRERHPGLRIVGVRHGYFDHSAGSAENEAILEEINATAPDILLVGLGMPLQEIWLTQNRHRLDRWRRPQRRRRLRLRLDEGCAAARAS